MLSLEEPGHHHVKSLLIIESQSIAVDNKIWLSCMIIEYILLIDQK